MHQPSPSTNVVGMNLKFYTDRPIEIRLSPYVVKDTIAYRVVKVERSKVGFRTQTGTLHSCAFCRNEDHRRSGREPFTTATWLLTGESGMVMNPIETLALCSDHFREMRDQQKKQTDRGPWSESEVDYLNAGVSLVDFLDRDTRIKDTFDRQDVFDATTYPRKDGSG